MDTATGGYGSGAPASPPCEASLYVEVRQAADGRVAVLSLHGDLNTYTVPTVWARIEAAVAHGTWSLVLDLAGVGFLDAEGIGILIRAKRLAALSEGTLVLAEVAEQGRKTLRVKGLAEVLPVFPSVAAAVTFLASWGTE